MRFFLITFSIFISTLCFSQVQVLDDSTVQIYGPNSVNYIFESDLLNNSSLKSNPDTIISKFYISDPVLKNNWLYQDLGNVGSAAKAIFFKPSYSIERQIGQDVFNLYAPKLNEIKYYNTRSPFTNLLYIQGFKGFSQLDFTHSQNINSRFNLTLDVTKFNSSKQIDASTVEDRLIDHWNYNLSSNYISKNKKYQVLGVFYHFNHLQNEQGGIDEKDNLSILPKDLLGSYRNNYQSQLGTAASSRERWNNIHIFHQYKLKNGFQVFHILDVNRQKYFFTDYLLKTNVLKKSYNLPGLNPSIDTLLTNTLFKTYTNKFGLKGRYKGFDYRAFAKYRIFNLNSNFLSKYQIKSKSEIFIGGQAAYYLKDSTNNLILETEFSSNLGYLVSGKIKYKGLSGEFYQAFTPPSIFSENYFNPIFELKNNFQNQFNTFISASYNLAIKNFSFKPSISNTIYGNYIYYDTKMKAVQASTPFNILSIETFLNLSKSKFVISNQNIITLNTSSSIFRVPKIINNTHVEFKIRYAKVLDIYTGLDIYYKSKYLADSYTPMLQQFYLQNEFYVWGFPVVDPFVALNVNKVRLLFKFGHANQGLFSQGFYTTPYYLAMPRAFLLKVNWPLFD